MWTILETPPLQKEQLLIEREPITFITGTIHSWVNRGNCAVSFAQIHLDCALAGIQTFDHLNPWRNRSYVDKGKCGQTYASEHNLREVD